MPSQAHPHDERTVISYRYQAQALPKKISWFTCALSLWLQWEGPKHMNAKLEVVNR